MPAAAAVLGVGGVLELGEGERVVVDAEVAAPRWLAAEVGDQRVVGVQHERAARPARATTTSAQRSAMISSSP